MEPLPASPGHCALLASKFPFRKDRVNFIRYVFAFLRLHRDRAPSAILSLPLRGKQPEEEPKDNSSLEKCTDTNVEDEETLRMFTWKDEYPDFAVVCANRRYLAHKDILEESSPYFERMFRFKGVETTEKEVKLKGLDPSLVEHVLDFMYTDQYSLPGGMAIPTAGWCNHSSAALRDGPPNGAEIFKRKCVCSGKILCSSHLLSHICIYAIADYFDMPILKEYALQGTLDVLHVFWGDKGLELADALEEAFTSTPDEDRGIRDAVVNTLKDHPGLWVDEGDVYSWLDDNPDVMEEVTGEKIDRVEEDEEDEEDEEEEDIEEDIEEEDIEDENEEEEENKNEVEKEEDENEKGDNGDMDGDGDGDGEGGGVKLQ